jgi:hypothetical protein
VDLPGLGSWPLPGYWVDANFAFVRLWNAFVASVSEKMASDLRRKTV